MALAASEAGRPLGRAYGSCIRELSSLAHVWSGPQCLASQNNEIVIVRDWQMGNYNTASFVPLVSWGWKCMAGL